MNGISEAIRRVHLNLDQVRGDILRLKNERSTIAGMPVPEAEALTRLDQALAIRAGTFDPQPYALTGADGGLPVLPAFGHMQDPTSFFYAIHKDVIRAFYGAAIKAQLEHSPPGLPAAERRVAVAKLNGQILELERQEEALIEEAEAAGIIISRRPDADPRAVLGAADDAKIAA